MGFVTPDYYILIPVHNGASLLPELLFFLTDLSAPSAEIVLVDDGSHDESWNLICRLAEQPPAGIHRIRGIRLDKNRGQQSALLAGLTTCRGKPVITMDDDLSHPPRTITGLLKAIEEGTQLAYALPPRRPGSALRRIFSRLHQLHMSIITNSSLSLRVGSYRGISPELTERILSGPLYFPYISAQALSLRPAPSAAMVPSSPFPGGTRGRITSFSLLKLEYRLAAAYGPLGILLRNFQKKTTSESSAGGQNAEEIARTWITEETGS